MALYEYQCKKCGRKTEVIQLFSDPAPEECPLCGGTLTKLLSSPAFQFKGSGFYLTDYGKSGRKAEDSSREKEGDSSKAKDAEAGAASGAGAESKGDPAGDSSKEKKDSKDSAKEKKDLKDSSKEKAPDAAKNAGPSDSSAAGSSKKNTKRK